MGLIRSLEGIGADPGDDLDTRLQKQVLVVVSSLIIVLAILWSVLYYTFDERLAAMIPAVYAVSSSVSMAVFAVTRRYRLFRSVQLLLILLLPFLLQIALGGFVNASAVIIWSLLAPLGALAMAGRRQASFWFAGYGVLVVAAQLIQPTLNLSNNLPTSLVAAFFVMNIVAATGVAFLAMHYFVGLKDEAFQLLEAERAKSDRLLLNVLPGPIAEELKEGGGTIARQFPAMSVLFADVVGFTPMSQGLSPEELVEMLNAVFSHFDGLVERYGLEKIRTIGDSYMAAAGVPISRDDHAHALARFALEIASFERSPLTDSDPMVFRIGMASGPAVAGVIGRAKFQYDVWGDTVNIASRMESHGVPGRIQVNETAFRLIRDDFVLEPRGIVEVKGKGPMPTWFLLGSR